MIGLEPLLDRDAVEALGLEKAKMVSLSCNVYTKVSTRAPFGEERPPTLKLPTLEPCSEQRSPWSYREPRRCRPSRRQRFADRFVAPQREYWIAEVRAGTSEAQLSAVSTCCARLARLFVEGDAVSRRRVGRHDRGLVAFRTYGRGGHRDDPAKSQQRQARVRASSCRQQMLRAEDSRSTRLTLRLSDSVSQ